MHVCTESKLYSCVHVEVRRLDSTCTFHIDLAYYCEEGAHGGKLTKHNFIQIGQCSNNM
jgi:hypothetical protein